MSLTKNNLEEEKAAANNQMDQDYWAEKGGWEKAEEELRDDLNVAHLNLEACEEDMKAAASRYGATRMEYIDAGERLAKFLEQNPSKTIAGIDFSDSLDALNNLK